MTEIGKEYLSDTLVLSRDVYESTQPDSGSKSVLRVIKGPVAEWDKLNRNKRKYSEKLWDRVLETPYVKEQLRYKTLYGEANHPTDRYEVDFGRVSHRISEMWKVPATNQIYATIEILDTPLGRILNTLYDAGGVIGYSSRAGGSLTPRKGYTEVDEDSYNFVTFDAVPFPSVESARPPIVEGKEVEISKAVLPDSIHDRLCEIISESTSENREVIKSLIYSLEGYDLSKEISLLEGVPSSVSKNEPKEETTMSLLKESSLQIDRLRSTNQTLQTAKSALEEENKSLRENLNSSLANISRLMLESKNFETSLNESMSKSDDTIKGLKSRIRELDGEIKDRDLEIERLESVHRAFRAVQEEKKGLQSELVYLRENAERQESLKNSKSERELEEVYKEVAVLVGESEQKDLRISQLLESIERLENQVSVLESSNRVAEEKSQRVDESVQRAESLSSENIRLKRQIEGLSESLRDVETRSDSYRDELISVIASGYSLTVESVRAKLPVGFTKSDVYNVCETMSHSMDKRMSYPSIIEESSESHGEKKESNMPGPRVAFIDRRGRGIQ